MKKFLVSVFCFLSLLSFEACVFGKSAKVGEEFTLKPKEAITIEGAGIKITLDEVGREWLVNNGGERPYCKISIVHKSSEIKVSVRFGNPAEINGYEVRLVKANPFSNSNATFIVNTKAEKTSKVETDSTKVAVVKFLSKYELKAEDDAKETEIKIPDKLSSPPFVHYQLASQSVDLDLTPFTGKTLILLTYTLKGKAANGSKFFAHLVLNAESIVGAWLSTNAPVAPGITSVTRKLDLK